MAVEDAVLPSWSWVSWQGNVQSESWQSGHDYLRQNNSAEQVSRWQTIPTVQWHYSEDLSSTRYPIVSRAPEWRHLYQHTSTLLPPGWKHHTDAATDDSYFTHESIPNHQFWYPIPVGIGNGRASRSRYLHCKTRRASLEVFPEPYRSCTGRCTVVALRDPDGKFAGCLRLNVWVQDARSSQPLTAFDLIELSSGSVCLDNNDGEDLLDHPLTDVFDEWAVPYWDKDRKGIYEFYNVMFIEWKAPGVASRLAVGRVFKSVWERIAREEGEVAIS
ncbi:hypothetical protein B0H67DRAFT_479808 [Lasiosphaeris hirsuta]|uniref:Uncharacterized protein n=1 Tax=Lasiosphaeris hirsuta TaxID=260670 RepID=A0AA40E224_9PEZI|nr:hypothetical protein B0H67DRAFT_479808 [Lasiosphaeris hirsuta]